MWKCSSFTENIINWKHLCFPLLQKEKKKGLVQSSVIQNIWMYNDDLKGWILLVFTHFLLSLTNSKHNSSFKIFNNKGSNRSGKLNTGGIIFSSAASMNTQRQHPGLHIAEPVQPILYWAQPWSPNWDLKYPNSSMSKVIPPSLSAFWLVEIKK